MANTVLVIFTTLSIWTGDIIFGQQLSCFQRADLVFVLDISSSIGPSNVRHTMQFAMDVVDKLAISSTEYRTGVIIYNSAPLEVLSLSSDKNSVLLALNWLYKSAERIARLKTNTVEALQMLLDSFRHKSRPNVPKIGILVTDDGPVNAHLDKLPAVVDELRQMNAAMYVVSTRSLFHVRHLVDIASEPKSKFMITLPDYTHLNALAKRMVASDCSARPNLYCEADKITVNPSRHYMPLTCWRSVAVTFVLDTSTSLTNLSCTNQWELFWHNYVLLLQSVSNSISALLVDRRIRLNFRFGLVVCSRKFQDKDCQRVFEPTNRKAYMKSKVEQFINDTYYRGSGRPSLPHALLFAQKSFKNDFSSEVAILVTAAGEPYLKSTMDEMKRATETLKLNNVKLAVVSIGNSAVKDELYKSMLSVEDHYFTVNSIQDLRKSTWNFCDVPEPTTKPWNTLAPATTVHTSMPGTKLPLTTVSLATFSGPSTTRIVRSSVSVTVPSKTGTLQAFSTSKFLGTLLTSQKSKAPVSSDLSLTTLSTRSPYVTYLPTYSSRKTIQSKVTKVLSSTTEVSQKSLVTTRGTLPKTVSQANLSTKKTKRTPATTTQRISTRFSTVDWLHPCGRTAIPNAEMTTGQLPDGNILYTYTCHKYSARPSKTLSRVCDVKHRLWTRSWPLSFTKTNLVCGNLVPPLKTPSSSTTLAATTQQSQATTAIRKRSTSTSSPHTTQMSQSQKPSSSQTPRSSTLLPTLAALGCLHSSLPIFLHAHVVLGDDRGDYKVGEVVTYNCSTGYLASAGRSQGIARCGEDRQWHTNFTDCTILTTISVTSPTPPLFTVKPTTPPSTTRPTASSPTEKPTAHWSTDRPVHCPDVFTCDAGCLPPLMTCDGVFDCFDLSDEVSCALLKPRRCQQPKPITNTDATLQRHPNGDLTVEYICLEGTLKAREKINQTCNLATDTWSPIFPDGWDFCGPSTTSAAPKQITTTPTTTIQWTTTQKLFTTSPIQPSTDRPPHCPRQFSCENGCLPEFLKCDGVFDCFDLSDELTCSVLKSRRCQQPKPIANSDATLQRHPNGDRTVEYICLEGTLKAREKINQTCNIATDTWSPLFPDGWDFCGPLTTSASPKQVTTTPTTTIQWTTTTKFYATTPIQPTTDRPSHCPRQFSCENSCLPEFLKCDGVFDCFDLSDELTCTVYKTRRCDHPASIPNTDKTVTRHGNGDVSIQYICLKSTRRTGHVFNHACSIQLDVWSPLFDKGRDYCNE